MKSQNAILKPCKDSKYVKSFLEASALDSTNVESAFTSLVTEIYHGVSQRGITEGVGEFARPGPGAGQTVHLSETEEDTKQKLICCKIV